MDILKAIIQDLREHGYEAEMMQMAEKYSISEYGIKIVLGSIGIAGTVVIMIVDCCLVVMCDIRRTTIELSDPKCFEKLYKELKWLNQMSSMQL